MSESVAPFDRFMGRHRPLGDLVDRIDAVIWEQGVLDPAIKERARIASADELGCGY